MPWQGEGSQPTPRGRQPTGRTRRSEQRLKRTLDNSPPREDAGGVEGEPDTMKVVCPVWEGLPQDRMV
jgi:hypothetical protein